MVMPHQLADIAHQSGAVPIMSSTGISRAVVPNAEAEARGLECSPFQQAQ